MRQPSASGWRLTLAAAASAALLAAAASAWAASSTSSSGSSTRTAAAGPLLTGPLYGSTPAVTVRGVSAGHVPWVVSGQVTLTATRLQATGSSLLVAAGYSDAGKPVPQKLVGTTLKFKAVGAAVTCAEDPKGPVAVTAPASLSPTGEFKIDAAIALKGACTDPVVLVGPVKALKGKEYRMVAWFASTDFLRNYGAAPKAAPTATVEVKTGTATVKGKAETVLTDSQGMTLYYFTKDTPDHVACTGACAKLWPPLLVPSGAKVESGQGVTGKLSTVKGQNGLQVEYDGHPLYRWSADRKPGQATGEGFKGIWYVATPSMTPATTGQPTGKGSSATQAASKTKATASTKATSTGGGTTTWG